MSECWQCSGTGKTPAGMDWGGNNAKPTRIKLGPCPVCSGGMVCPWCLYELKAPDGCRCGWKPRPTTIAELKGEK